MSPSFYYKQYEPRQRLQDFAYVSSAGIHAHHFGASQTFCRCAARIPFFHSPKCIPTSFQATFPLTGCLRQSRPFLPCFSRFPRALQVGRGHCPMWGPPGRGCPDGEGGCRKESSGAAATVCFDGLGLMLHLEKGTKPTVSVTRDSRILRQVVTVF